MSGMIVGGPRAWKKRRHGNLAVAFHWVNGEGSMVIVNTAVQKCPAIVIGNSAIHLYVNSKTGDPTHYCADKALEYGQMLGLARMEAHKLMKIIVEAVPDLLEMPPEPDWARKEAPGAMEMHDAEVKIIADGQTVMDAPVRLQ